jgi:hypothetical protein
MNSLGTWRYGLSGATDSAAQYETLSGLLSTTPTAGMRATALDAPGSMLYEVGGKWGGSLGSVSQATLAALTAGQLAMFAEGIAVTVSGVTMYYRGGVFRVGGIRQESRAVWAPFPDNPDTFDYGSSTNKAVQTCIRAPIKQFRKIRVWLANKSNAATYDGWRGIIAAPSSGATSFAPSVGGAVTEDSATGWTTVGGAISIEVAPANIGLKRPRMGHWISNVIPVVSVPASDGGNPWLFLRGSRSATNYPYVATRGDTGGAYGFERITKHINDSTGGPIAADSVTSAATFDAAAVSTSDTNFLRVDFYGDDEFVSVDLCGASTLSVGVGSGYSWPIYAVPALRDAMISPYILGTGSLVTAGIQENAEWLNSKTNSRFMAIPVFSSIDGYTAELVRVQMARFFNLRELLYASGVTAIACIFPHNAAYDNATYRAVCVQAISDLYSSGCPILDFRYVIGDPAHQYDSWLATMSSDGTHPNAVGEQALAAALPSLLSMIVYQ